MFKYVYKIAWLLVFLFTTSLFSQTTDKADPDPNRYQKEIDLFVQWDAKNSFPANAVLFVGSSSIRMWPTHQAFPQYPVINRGFGGAHISDIQFLYETVIHPYLPSLIVFYAGDNDIAYGKNVDQVFKDYVGLIEKIFMDNPDVRFIYLTIKPSISRWEHWQKMQALNQKISDYNDHDNRLFNLDISDLMLDYEGKPKSDIFLEDGLHLNPKGYLLWNSLLDPLLAKTYRATQTPGQ
ncbi:MAG: hypothetical protein E4H13_11085 [Calditrichales bacterium]|nr:MAG: hypothetical protein E4H13_11085 [Calditrichales bacterium]